MDLPAEAVAISAERTTTRIVAIEPTIGFVLFRDAFFELSDAVPGARAQLAHAIPRRLL
jgi:CRP-like cAMP-binding protein